MYLEVYPDIIFVLNFCTNLVILSVLKQVNRKKSGKGRIAAGAAVGAVSSVFISIFISLNPIIRFILMNLVTSIIMIRIIFGKMKLTDFFKQVIMLYLITYCIGGLINSIYYYTNIRFYMIRLSNGIIFSNLPFIFIVCIFLLLIPIFSLLIWLFRWYRGNLAETYEVDLVLDNRSIHAKALLDTGNCLYDPIFKRPVMIIENSLIDRLLSPEFKKDIEEAKNYVEGNDFNIGQWNISAEHVLRIRFVPYQSIGKKQGILLGLILDKVLIHTGKETICNEKVTAAICDNRLSAKEDYHVILHKELL